MTEGSRPRTRAGSILKGAPEAGFRRGSERQSTSSIERILNNPLLITAFQPVFELSARNVIGAEALTRFISEDGEQGQRMV